MNNKKIIYKNRLPHIAPIGAQFFVTFRLAESLPISFLKQEHINYQHLIKSNDNQASTNSIFIWTKEKAAYFKNIDQLLDQAKHGPTYLAQANIAKIVADRLFEFDGQLYDLHAFCIMPNHVHILIDTYAQIIGLDLEGKPFNDVPKDYVQLSSIMHLIKGGTARKANILLKRSGSFWQKDSFDRYIRDEKEWHNTINYILNNPVNARLVNSWEEWEFSYFVNHDKNSSQG